MTLYSMIKIWNEAFLKKLPETRSRQKPVSLGFVDLLPSVILGAATVLMGIFAASMVDLSMQAGDALLDPVHYIESVMSK